MKLPIFLVYLLVELAAFVGLAYAIGFWWTLLIAFATVVIGAVLVRRQAAKVFSRLNEARDDAALANRMGDTPDAKATLVPVVDTALLALSFLLILVPGLVTTVIGILLLLPPIRALGRPLLIAVGARKLSKFVDRVGGYGTVVTGRTVVDGTVTDPQRPAGEPRLDYPRD